ncbi:MAG TPA: YsnF/AvaK domain-containing protein [Pyrinomonadaceae bacterium]|nr:YsnF/AvaK domain-containing protein [Pyrinomonadaceae bacterium]
MANPAESIDKPQAQQNQPPAAADNSAAAAGAIVVPVIQEQVTVDKKIVETGKVRISKRVSQHEELIDVPILREQVNIERVPVNQVVDAPPQVRQEGDTMIIPIVEEQVFYQKRLVLVEELRIQKQIVEQHNPQQMTLLKEEVEINRTAAENEISGRENGV